MGACTIIDTYRVVTDNVSTMMWDSIPQTYRHLEIRGVQSSNQSDGGASGFLIYFNDNTSATWTTTTWGITSSNTRNAGGHSTMNWNPNWSANASVGFNTFMGWHGWIHGYSDTDTTKNMAVYTSGYVQSSWGYSGYIKAGQRYGSESVDGAIVAAISKLRIVPQATDYFTHGTEFTLYGWDDA